MKDQFEEFKKEFKESLKSAAGLKSQLPNLLTLSRGVAPLVVTPLILTGNVIPGLIAAGLFASTDFFDGYLARKYNNISKFGEHLDQVCDKIFAVSLLLTSAVLNPIMLLNVIPEVAIAAINVNSLNKGNKPQTSQLGKIKTAMLSATILLALLPGINIALPVLSIPTLLAQITTAVDYKNIDRAKDKEKARLAQLQPTPVQATPEVQKRVKKVEQELQVKPLSHKQQMIEPLEYNRELIAPEQAKIKKLVFPTQKDK